MSIYLLKRILSLFLVSFIIIACENSEIDTSSLPALDQIINSPSNQFILDSFGISKVSHAFPHKGLPSGCSHPGAHIHFKNEGAPYLVPLLAPADGIVVSTDKCTELLETDRFGVSLAIARHDGQNLEFYFSIEPAITKNCSQGDPDFYSEYLVVTPGQHVKKGDVLAYFPKTDTGHEGPHLHFHLMNHDGHYCPNIFNSAITEIFGQLYGFETCDGTSMPETFCYLPSPGEDLTGL